MTFNQWAAGGNFDNSMRLTLEAVWNALIGSGCAAGEAGSLLTDLVQSIPEPERDWEEGDYL